MTAAISLLGFELPLDVIVLGILGGTVYALFGMGLTLTYQSSRVINFSQGALGALAHLMLAWLVLDKGWAYWPALAITLAVGIGAGGLIEIGVIRRLSGAPRLVVLVATIGVAQLLTIPNAMILDLQTSNMPQSAYPTPFDASFTVGSLRLGSGAILVLLVAPVLVVGLTMFLRRTSVGMASRAIAENSEAAELSGVPIRRISWLIWSLSGFLAATAAILDGPDRPIVSFGGGTSVGGLLLRGLGAAMMGGLVSLPQVFGAGVLLGLIEALVRWNFTSGGTTDLVMMIIIVASLLLRRDLRQLARGSEESSWSLAGAPRALAGHIRNHPRVRAVRTLALGGLLLAAVVLPALGGAPQRILYSAIAIYIIIALSLVILTGWAGQVSLGHFGFVAVGALVGGRMHQLGYPVYGALLWVVVVGAIAAVIVGLPALRIRGLYLAVTTLAFAVIVDAWLLRQDWLVKVTAQSSSTTISRRAFLGIDFQDELNYFYLCLGALLLTALLVSRLRTTGVARAIIAVRDNEPMAASLGVGPAAVKMGAFVVSGMIASIAGYLYGMLLVDFRFAGLTSPGLSTSVLTMVVFGGATSITGAVLGALYIRGLPYFIDTDWVLLLTSGLGLLVVLLFLPEGLAGLAFRVRDRVASWLAGTPLDTGDSSVDEGGTRPQLPARAARTVVLDGPAIEAIDVSKSYGGVQALRSVSVRADQGDIVGLLGPNGAGKTTLFDVLSGQITADAGQVLLRGTDVTSLAPEERARIGLGRSFQRAQLFDDLTVSETLRLALERQDPTELVPSALGLPPARAGERRKQIRADELIELLGLTRFADKRASELSTGTRRVAELGCVVALGADVVLLDEPTGGLAQRETEAFAGVIRDIRDHLDATMVVVAHDIPLIMDVADRLYVLASGQVIGYGPPTILQTDAAVVAAYLGAEEGEVAMDASPRRARRRTPLVAEPTP